MSGKPIVTTQNRQIGWNQGRHKGRTFDGKFKSTGKTFPIAGHSIQVPQRQKVNFCHLTRLRFILTVSGWGGGA